MVLRDPVERTYSHWKERRLHTEDLSFEEALVTEESRCRGEEERLIANPRATSFSHQHQSYLGQSDYLPMLERWYEHVPADQIIVWISEEFYADPRAHVDALSGRLGLPALPMLDIMPHNAVPAGDMDPAIRRELVEHFRPQVKQLADFLERDLPWQSAPQV